MKNIPLSCIALYCFFAFQNLSGQTTIYPSDIQARIEQVEQYLMPWNQISDTIKWTLKERMDFYGIQGLSIAVVNNNKIEWAKGYGWADTAEKRPVDPRTLFQAASISKSLNGVGILKLVQEEKIDLNTDINDYLNSWKFPYNKSSKGKKITLNHLLSHTAGLNVHGFPGYGQDEPIPSIKEVLNGKKDANTDAVRSQFEPGQKFQYSGGGTSISQMVLMDITQQPYDEYMWLEVLKPMGMQNSTYKQPPGANFKNQLATAYRSDGKKIQGKYHIYPEQAAAGLWTNPTDLCHYIIETQLSYLGKSSKVLTQEMTEKKLTAYFGGFSALGVFLDNRNGTIYFNHSGGNEGFRCKYYGSLEEGKGLAIMINSDSGSILDEIMNSIAYVYDWKDFYSPEIRNTVDLPDSLLDEYTGTYMLKDEPVLITFDDNQLLLNFRNKVYDVYFTSEVDFFLPGLQGENKFQRNIQGNVTGYTINGKEFLKKVE